MTEKSKKVSTEPYKGVRDFYPEDMAVQNYIFDTWRAVSKRYGYEEYGASILEPAELYRSKTSEEIVNEQTYTFTDRGDREVTLRPEMTPTVARLVAGRRRELSYPLRWFSIPNCFRYERPQRGRTREFWQLNADIFGVAGIEADVEIISLAYDIMRAFGAQDSDFEIRINNRGTLKNALIESGMSEDDAEAELRKMDKGAGSVSVGQDTPGAVTTTLIEQLQKRGIQNVRFDSTMVRGFQYYTGTVFEIFDTDQGNPRALFGGGRYDRLLENFGDDTLPAVGFGMGDVVIRDFLETHGLLPKTTSTTTVMLCPISHEFTDTAETLARELRDSSVTVAVYYGEKKIGDQIKSADKKHIPYIIAVGEEEQKNARYTLKRLSDGEETVGTAEELSTKLHS